MAGYSWLHSVAVQRERLGLERRVEGLERLSYDTSYLPDSFHQERYPLLTSRVR